MTPTPDQILLRAYRAVHRIGLLAPYLKTVGAFTAGLWRAVREFYNGGGVGEFIDSFNYWITTQLNKAWREGARDVGVYPEDFEQEDLDEIQKIIDRELDYVLGFAESIETARRNGSGVEQFRSRCDTWANRYNETVNYARLWFSGKEKMEFILGPTENHCHTEGGKAGCADLAGIVLWAKDWKTTGIMPGHPDGKTTCGGWKCQCQIIPTTKRRTPNGLQKVMAMLGQ